MNLLFLLLKIFVLGLPYIFLIGIINMVLVIASRPFANNKALSLPYSIFVTGIYIYLYSLWGAFLRAVVLIYSSDYNKWILIILCIIEIGISITFITRQMNEEKEKMNDARLEAVYSADSDFKDAFGKSITVICLSLDSFIFI